MKVVPLSKNGFRQLFKIAAHEDRGGASLKRMLDVVQALGSEHDAAHIGASGVGDMGDPQAAGDATSHEAVFAYRERHEEI